jgi:phosphoglycerol transferase MdoB-like AlkP superfamily enzyme
MKGAVVALFIGFALLVVLYFKINVNSSKATVDIYLHDTFFVLSYASVILFILLFLGTFFSIGGVIGSLFKSRLFWILTILFLSVDIYYFVMFYKAFNGT